MESNEVEQIYLRIPTDYVCVYHRILEVMSEYGEDMLKDCKASCTDKNRDIIDCFNMFNAALACVELDQRKKADLIIKYVAAKLNQLYPSQVEEQSFVMKVGENDSIVNITCKGLFDYDKEIFNNIEMFYIGSGIEYLDAIKDENKKETVIVAGSYDVTVSNNGEHIYIIISDDYSIKEAYMGNIEIPFASPIQVLYEGHSIKVYESINTYDAGNYTINIV